MTNQVHDLLNKIRRDDIESGRIQRPTPVERSTIHYSELPEDTSGNSTAEEWNLYRREVGRLLAEGHEGKWVVIKGAQIIGIWPNREEAKAVALARFSMQPVLIQQVLCHLPVLRGPTFLRQWRT